MSGKRDNTEQSTVEKDPRSSLYVVEYTSEAPSDAVDSRALTRQSASTMLSASPVLTRQSTSDALGRRRCQRRRVNRIGHNTFDTRRKAGHQRQNTFCSSTAHNLALTAACHLQPPQDRRGRIDKR